MSFTKENYGLTYSLLVLIGLLVCCNLYKFLDNYQKEKFQNESSSQNTPTTTFNPNNYYCPHLQHSNNKNSSSNNANNVEPVYCPGEHPNIPCQLVKSCNCKD